MSGARISPRAVINLIKDNLRDRYDSGFPVLKEIVQNADDAKANKLVMGWCKGIDDPGNPLLEDPALFFINDAPLLEEHANGILAVADSSKSSSSDSIGKFGLGMKSLFHLCEAFFFISSSWQSDEWAANVFNPRAYLRSEWDSFSGSDKQKIENKLQSVLKQDSGFAENSWFVVWVPLRTRERSPEKRAITPSYYPADALPDFLLEQDLTDKIANMFPLLKRLESVNLLIEENGNFKQWFNIELSSGSERSQFVGQPRFSGGTSLSKLHGNVEIFFSESKKTLNYAGVESLLDIESLNALKSVDQGWPTSWQQTSEEDDDETVPEKAEQHVAVVISRMPADEGKAVVTASWAVFLPLSGAQEFKTFNISGGYSYHIHLHGYFFVDAGRKGIHGHDDIGESPDMANINGDEKRLLKAWNLTLASNGTLNQLLPAFKYLVEACQIKLDDINGVSAAIKTVLPIKYLSWVTRNYSWMYRLTPDHQSWQLIQEDFPIRQIPKPSNDDYARIWETFPWLRDNSNYLYLAELEKNNVIPREGTSWSVQEFERVLSIDIQNVFTSQIRLSYFNEFLELAEKSVGLQGMQQKLLQIARTALAELPLTILSKQTSLFQKFIGYIFPGKRFSLPVSKDDSVLWNSIGNIQADTLILPAFLDSESCRASSPIELDDAIRILKSVDNMLRISHKREAVESAERVIRNILQEMKKCSKTDLETLYEKCGDLRLFSAYDLRSRKDVLKSRNQLRELHQQGRVFRRTDISFGLGQELQEAIRAHIYFLTKETIGSIFRDDEVCECNDQAILKFLSFKPELANEQCRIKLLRKLAGASINDKESQTGFRYLLHGCCEDDGEQELWENDTSTAAVWLELWKLRPNADQPEWSVLSPALSDTLTNPIRKQLNIQSISSARVLDEWGNLLSQYDFASLNLTAQDVEEILIRVENKALWRELPLHETLSGQRVAIDGQCVLAGKATLPKRLKITQIKVAANDEVMRKQKDFIEEVGPLQLVRIALSQKHPEHHGEFILEKLSVLHRRGTDLPEELCTLLQRTPWLVLNNGEAASLVRVLPLDRESWLQAIMLCEREDTKCYYLEQLSEIFTGREEHLSILKKYLRPFKDNSKLLITEAAKIAEYALGDISGLTDTALGQLTSTSISELRPGWALVCELYDNLSHDFDPAEIEPLCKQLPEDRLLECIAILTHQSANQVAEARELFLRALCKLDDPISALKKVKLRTKADTFRASSSLAVAANTFGISGRDLVHDSEWAIIKVVLDTIHFNSPMESKKSERYQNRAEVFKAYFKDWDHVNPDAIAAFLTLLYTNDTGIEKLAEHYFRRSSHETIIDSAYKLITHSGQKRSFRAMNIQPFICTQDKVCVSSIFNEKIEVERPTKLDSILFMERAASTTSIQYIHLIKFNVKSIGKSDLLELLRVSSEQIIQIVFGINVSLKEIWSKFGGSNQFDIKLAQHRILNNVIPTLERLRIKQDPIGSLIYEYYKIEGQVLQSTGNENEEKLTSVKREIQSCIQTRMDIQQLILDGVRREIGDHSQYSKDSVPFELFQNADDALGEKKEMLGAENVPHSLAKFIIRNEQDSVSFYHWGREINDCAASYEQGKGRFDRDLIKMVSLNISDKGGGVTGKFGLGFKSSLLISDQPEILSGEMAVVIRGGILPVVIKDHKTLMERVNAVSIDAHAPTLLRFPLRDKVVTKEVLSRFRLSAGILCVFSRHIRTIEIDNQTVEWTPKKASRIPGLHFGAAYLPNKEGELKKQKIVHYRSQNGQFVFQLGAEGMLSLEDRQIPKFWVLNPVQEGLSAGFIIESNFQVDIGRSQLATNNDKNIRQMSELARDLSELLRQIHDWIQDDWQGFRIEWGLKEQLESTKFWSSIWHVLTTRWPSSLISESKAVLFKTLFTVRGGLLDFYKDRDVLPNRLMTGKKLALMSLKNVQFSADQLLSDVFRDLSELPALQTCIHEQSIVDDKVGDFLQKIQYLPKEKECSLASIIDEHVPGGRVNTETATVFGRLFNEKLNEKLDKASFSEAEDLRRTLRTFSFQSERESSWYLSDKLVIPSDDLNAEEAQLAAFAPSYARLSTRYDNAGQAFFKECRGERKPSVKNIAEWARTVPDASTNRRNALMRYLISGYNGKQLASTLKVGERPGWMDRVDAALLKNTFAWNAKDIDEYMRLMKDTLSDIERRVRDDINASQGSKPANEALADIYEWWQSEQALELPRYVERLYGQPLPWKLMQEDADLEERETRKGWLKLFYLGACQTIGRAHEGHHRQALLWMERKGWWDKMASVEGMQPEDWTGIIDEYLSDAQVDEKYRIWLQIVPLYNFVNNLEDLVEKFLVVDRLSELNDLLKSSESPVWQGTGDELPALRRMLGIGANFIIRELIRNRVIPEVGAHHRAFMLSGKARKVIAKIGYPISDVADPYQSEEVYEFFCSKLHDENKATFDLCFDIPFQILAEDENRLTALLAIGMLEMGEQETTYYG